MTTFRKSTTRKSVRRPRKSTTRKSVRRPRKSTTRKSVRRPRKSTTRKSVRRPRKSTTRKSVRRPRVFPKHENQENNEKVLFVFYTLDKAEYWSYPKLPKGWRWVGSGSTSPINSENVSLYQREEQFNGPKENINMMRILLNNKFQDLQNKGIVKLFKIEGYYNP